MNNPGNNINHLIYRSVAQILTILTVTITITSLVSPPDTTALPLPYSAAAPEDPDTVKVLIVFVQFLDDRSPENRELYFRQWPVFDDRTQLPASAKHLLSDSPHAPFVDSTLTAYFYRQSNGKLVLFGNVHPRTIVTSEPEASYHRPAGGYGHLTYDIVGQLDRDGVNFKDYDYDGDGIVDHIFVIIRRDSEKDARKFTWTGASCLDARCAGGPPAGRRLSPITTDGTTIDWNASGSVIFNRTPGNVNTHYWLIRMMAHEYGHDLWQKHFVHIPAISENDVPLESSFRSPTNTLGYVLMAGAGGGRDAQGDQTISAFERDLLGWIDCREPAASAGGVVVGDLYTTGECIRMDTGDQRRPWTLYVTNRQRIGPFDQYRTGGWEQQYEVGLLRTTGLLVGLASGVRYDVIPADNSLELSIYNSPYNGDLFRPGDQLTPWSRPNINGFNRYPAGFQPHWHAIDNIRRAEGDSLTLVFDYRQDFRESTVIRRDSWMGAETEGQRLTGRAHVKRGSLTIETHVQLAGRLVVENGATLAISEAGRLVVEDASALILHMGSRLVVDGALQVDGVLLPYADSSIESGDSARMTSGAGRRMR